MVLMGKAPACFHTWDARADVLEHERTGGAACKSGPASGSLALELCLRKDVDLGAEHNVRTPVRLSVDARIKRRARTRWVVVARFPNDGVTGWPIPLSWARMSRE